MTWNMSPLRLAGALRFYTSINHLIRHVLRPRIVGRWSSQDSTSWKAAKKRLAEFKTYYDSRRGLVCFSRNWIDPVLWSHYAQRHRGLCLGFDVKRDEIELVDYFDDRIRDELE